MFDIFQMSFPTNTKLDSTLELTCVGRFCSCKICMFMGHLIRQMGSELCRL